MQNRSDTGALARRRAPGGGRKKNFDTEAVLEQALDVFWRHGFGATTTRQLEDELGLTASSIYNAFGTKAELLDAAVDRYVNDLEALVLVPLREAPDPLTGLEQFIHVVSTGLDGQHPWGCLMVTLMSENAGREPRLTALTDGYLGTLRAELASTLARAADLGQIDAESIPQRLELLCVAVLGINTAARARLGSEAVAAMADATCSQIGGWRSGGVRTPSAGTAGAPPRERQSA